MVRLEQIAARLHQDSLESQLESLLSLYAAAHERVHRADEEMGRLARSLKQYGLSIIYLADIERRLQTSSRDYPEQLSNGQYIL